MTRSTSGFAVAYVRCMEARNKTSFADAAVTAQTGRAFNGAYRQASPSRH